MDGCSHFYIACGVSDNIRPSGPADRLECVAFLLERGGGGGGRIGVR